MEDARKYLKENPEFVSIFKNPTPKSPLSDNINLKQYKINTKPNNKPSLNFRHRDDGQNIMKDYAPNIGDETQDQIAISNENAEVCVFSSENFFF